MIGVRHVSDTSAPGYSPLFFPPSHSLYLVRMLRMLERVLRFLGLWRGPLPPSHPRDPYAWRPVPRRPQPKSRSGAVAVAEPDDPYVD